jgi:four helix bundle protein
LHERFGLVSQVRRAAVSAPSNLAEGAAKRGSKELGRYLDVANGSLAGVEYLLRLAKDLGYLNTPDHERLSAQRDEAARSVWLLYAAVRRRVKPT